MGRKKKEEPIIKIGQRVVVDIRGFYSDLSDELSYTPKIARGTGDQFPTYIAAVSNRPQTEENASSADDRVVILSTGGVPHTGLNILKRVVNFKGVSGQHDQFIVDEGEKE